MSPFDALPCPAVPDPRLPLALYTLNARLAVCNRTDWLMQAAPVFRGWTSSARPSWNEMAEVAGYVRAELEISEHAWGQACVVLGRMEAVTALAVIATRHAGGKVDCPGAVLRRMVELHGEGKLRLDESLFGLSERLKRTRQERVSR